MKTRAVVIAQPQQVELRDVELIDMGPEDVLIQTAYTSISTGTERMLLAGKMPHPALDFPVVPGYETVGRIIACGPSAPQQLEGQLVYVGGARCYQDMNAAWGGQAALLLVHHERVIPLGTLRPEAGVLLALGATALHGIDLLGADLSGKGVLVLGQGPVGQCAARLARARGAWVAVADRSAVRLNHAQADMEVLMQDQPLEQLIGCQVEIVIEATGSMEALTRALPVLAQEGTILLLGYYEQLQLPYMPLFLKQARLLTAREWATGDLLRIRDILQDGSIDVHGLITHTLPITRIKEAYALALDDQSCVKMLLSWQE